MKISLFAWILIASVIVGMASPSTQNSGNTETKCKNLLDSINDDNFPQFVAGGNIDFMKMEKSAFDTLVTQFGPQLSGGYHLKYLASKPENTKMAYYWQVIPNHKGKPLTATLVLRDNKIVGFWIQ
ncbi:MAG: hypothetical protein ABI443_05975 [Chthoniobacterales bacterium]